MDNSEIRNKLLIYYKENRLLSYIFSDDIDNQIKLKDITKEVWFMEFMESLINENYEFEFFGPEEKNNCYKMINIARFEAVNNNDAETIEFYNMLIRTLNKSNEENIDEFLKYTYILTSLNSRKEAKRLENKYIKFKSYFYWASQVSYYLLSDFTECPEILTKNEFCIHAIIDLCKHFPEIVKNDEYASKLYSIILANDEYKKVIDVNFSLLNKKTGKYLIKTISN